MDLQELVSRARILFGNSPKREATFDLVNGKLSAKEISVKSGRPFSATLDDLAAMKDMEIIRAVTDEKGVVKKANSIIYEKNPILKHLSKSVLKDHTKTARTSPKERKNSTRDNSSGIHLPSEQEILDICNHGEDQIYEFKQVGVEMKVLSKEICAFANTKLGGLIFYGIEDDGTIGDSDKKRQILDQSLQNSIRNQISPSISVRIVEKQIVGHTIMVILIPPWNRKDVYHYDGRVTIRKGTNVFYATPQESKQLHAGKYVV